MSMTSPEVWTVVVAAGAGRRFGAEKQFARLDGDTVIGRSCRIAATMSTGVVLVVPDPSASPVESLVRQPPSEGTLLATRGGATRAESVRRGLAVVPSSAAIVIVHDAARPLASPDLYRRVIDAVAAGAAAVVPGVEVADTLRRRGGGGVDRDGLVRVQTPQGFGAEALRAAHASGGEATDDATLAEIAGFDVVIVEGESSNLKITTPVDLVIASFLSGSDPAAPHREDEPHGE